MHNMSKIRNVIIIVIALVTLSLVAFSLGKTQVTKDISIEELKECETVYWTEVEPVYSTCTGYYETTICDDEPLNQSCHTEQQGYNYTCQTGTLTEEKSKEVCQDKELQVTVEKLGADENYKLLYGQWGKCSYQAQDGVAVITCDSQYDGDNNGVCTPGESCMQFRISKDGVQTLMKNSRDDFIESDASFFLEKLDLVVAE